MSTLIVAEWLAAVGGAERVIEQIALTCPDSRVVTVASEAGALPLLPVGSVRALVEGPEWLVGRRSMLAGLNMVLWPGRRITSADADLVISSHHLGSHWTALRSEVPHLSYVHTPARYAWFPHLDGRATSVVARPVSAAIRRLDRAAARRVTSYAANSRTTRERIRSVWQRDARIIHPPVDLERFRVRSQEAPDRYLVAVSRFVPYKRLDFAMAVAEAAGLPLKVVGGGPLERDLRRQAASARVEVEFLVGRSDAEVAAVMAGAQALVYPAVEDFGIVPVESMAAGTPVLAPAIGGTAETVVHGETGFLFDDWDAATWAARVQDITSDMSVECRRRADAFAPGRFREQISRWIEDEGGAACPSSKV